MHGMGKIIYNKGDKIVFIDEVEGGQLYTPVLYEVCTVTWEFEAVGMDKDQDRVIAIAETPSIVYRHNQFISLIEFRKQKIEKCLKRVIK